MEEKRRFDDKYFLSQLNKLTPTLSLGLIKEQMKTAIDTDNMSELLQSLESYRHASTITQKIALREMNEYVRSFMKNDEETEITAVDPQTPVVDPENPAADSEPTVSVPENTIVTDIVIDTIEESNSSEEYVENVESDSTPYPYLEPGDNVEVESNTEVESTVEIEEPETVSETVEMVIENVEEEKEIIKPTKKSSSKKK